MKLQSGYGKDDYRGGEREFRVMSLDEMKQLHPGQHVFFLTRHGTYREVKINGMPKLWKTRPNDVEVPVKYGLYEYSYARYINGEPSGETLLVEVKNENK